MDKYQSNSNNLSPRESFLMSLLNKVMKEYKALLEFTRRTKPFKIIEIAHLSSIPGETQFMIQLANKNCILRLTAGEIISRGYNLNDFNEFHATMIHEAAKGKLIEFLAQSNQEPTYKVVSKKFDAKMQKYIFILETKDQQRFLRTADELTRDKNLLANMNIHDIYDVGYTQGSESILKEKMALLLIKNN